MRLIVEKDFIGNIYVYRETEKHFKAAEICRQREGMIKYKKNTFDDECTVASRLSNGSYVVFEIKK